MYNMNTINYVQICFSLLISGTILMGSLLNYLEPYLPKIVVRSVRYGKFAASGKRIKYLEVPKSYFKHFYVWSAIYSTASLSMAVSVYVFGMPPPEWYMMLLDKTVGVFRYSTVSSACVFLSLCLLLVQCIRRFYDTHFVSVFSKNCYIHVSHYIIGYCHYLGVFGAIFAEAPVFAQSPDQSAELKWSDLKYKDYVAAIIFLWACYQQYNSNVILANLRKNKKGEIVTHDHKLPKGGLFEYIASPHISTEILMYICICIILWGNRTMLFVLAWVMSNQTEAAMLSYWWYKEKFVDFPKRRRALVPFIY